MWSFGSLSENSQVDISQSLLRENLSFLCVLTVFLCWAAAEEKISLRVTDFFYVYVSELKQSAFVL